MAPVKVSRSPKTTIVQDATPDTREPRAKRAVGAQRRTLHGDAPSAHAPGRDGRQAVRGDDMLRDGTGACRFRQIRRTREAARAPHRTSTLRGVNDPHRQGPGAARPRDTGVVHAPLSVHHWARRSADGKRRRPISTTSTRTTYCRAVLWPTTLARSPRTLASPTRMAVRVLGDKFTSGTCPPLWRESSR